MAQRSNIFGIPFGELTPVGLTLPDNLKVEQWEEVGLALGRAKGGLMWAVGDWWAFGEHRYGERAAIVKSEDWDGPAFQTCMDAASVCRRFETSSRDEVLMRKHGDDYAICRLEEALNLLTAAPLLCGNLNQHRTSWLVISVFQGVTHARPAIFEQEISLFGYQDDMLKNP